jgi:hypothetical protein
MSVVGVSGKHLLAASISPFDPSATFCAIIRPATIRRFPDEISGVRQSPLTSCSYSAQAPPPRRRAAGSPMTGTRSRRLLSGPGTNSVSATIGDACSSGQSEIFIVWFTDVVQHRFHEMDSVVLCGHSSCLCPSSSARPSLHFSENQPVPRKANIDVSLQDHAP